MTDRIAQLRAVEEAAEKARDYSEWLGSEQGVVLPEKECAEVAAILGTFANLPFRAVREELEAYRAGIAKIEAEWRRLLDEADDDDAMGAHVGLARHKRATARGLGDALRVLRAELDIYSNSAVLCPDPAGGEG